MNFPNIKVTPPPTREYPDYEVKGRGEERLTVGKLKYIVGNNGHISGYFFISEGYQPISEGTFLQIYQQLYDLNRRIS